MGKFLGWIGVILASAALGWGLWAAWPILFPTVPDGWLSAISRVDAALLQNRPDTAVKILDVPPKGLSAMGWLQWEKRVNSVAQRTKNWVWASKVAGLAQAQFPGNPQLAAFSVWSMLQSHNWAGAVALGVRVLKGTPWESLVLQAQIEGDMLPSGGWAEFRTLLGEPSGVSLALYGRLGHIAPDPALQKNTLLAALSQGRLDEARDYLSVLTPEQRDRPPFDRLAALMAYDQGDWARAAALLKSLASSQPENRLILADVYLHLGDREQARVIYDQMLADKINPVPVSLGVNRATLSLEEGDPPRALELLAMVQDVSSGDETKKLRLLSLEAHFRLGETDSVKSSLESLIRTGDESELALDAELLRGRLFPDWSSVPRMWSLLHRHPDNQPLAERLVWSLVSTQDYTGAHRALDLHEAALKKIGSGIPWWSLELRALMLAAEDRLAESSDSFNQVPSAWRDAVFYSDWALVTMVQAQTSDPEGRQPFLEAALLKLTHALDLLPPSTTPEGLKRRSLWLTRRGELDSALVPLENPAQRGTLRSDAAEDFRQAVQLDPDNLRASFFLRQALTNQQDKS